MKRIKYIINAIFLFVGTVSFTSCLESGLNELPAYEEADITDVYFEYRYEATRSDGVKDIKYIRMTNDKRQIDAGGTINMEIRVPATDGTFTESERAKVSLNNLVCYCYLSNVARIEPVDGAPVLGRIGNFSSAVKYKVTAADGKTSKLWTIHVVLIK
jgi:hypothetical protein